MSVLAFSSIKSLVENHGLIQNFSEHSLEGASYDMRLGQKYIKQGKTFVLSDEEPSLLIEPGDFLILTTLEILKMPLNLIGHNGIMSPWAKRGVVSLFSPQIDPGFEGFLVVPIFNAGDASITMNFRSKIFTVEFVYTDQDAPYRWADRFEPQTIIPDLVSPNAVRPNLADVDKMQERVRQLDIKVDNALQKLNEGISFLNGLQNKKAMSIGRVTILCTITSIIGGTIVHIYGDTIANLFR